jgi:hypothetical protein
MSDELTLEQQQTADEKYSNLAEYVYPKDRKERLLFANWLVGAIHKIYPPREWDYAHVPVRTAVLALLKEGVHPKQLLNAARNYRRECDYHKTPKKYTTGSCAFYRDGKWRAYAQTTVYGRTREEWARSGQDVGEWDRLSLEVPA